MVFKILQLHLRRVGVEARPDLVRGAPKGDNGGSPSQNNDGNGREKDPDDPPKDDKGSSDTTSAESQLPLAPGSSESHSLDDPPLSTTKLLHLDHKKGMVCIPPGFFKKQDIVSLLARQIFTFHVLPLYMESLYIMWYYSWELRQAV